MESSYDKILIGPSSPYTSLDELNIRLKKSGKISKTFFRRGYFGLRHTGKGRSIPKQSWVRPTIVNKEALDSLKDIDLKSYDVF